MSGGFLVHDSPVFFEKTGSASRAGERDGSTARTRSKSCSPTPLGFTPPSFLAVAKDSTGYLPRFVVLGDHAVENTKEYNHLEAEHVSEPSNTMSTPYSLIHCGYDVFEELAEATAFPSHMMGVDAYRSCRKWRRKSIL
jgi:hypothetical protein